MENQDPELNNETTAVNEPKVVVSNNDFKVGMFFDPEAVAVLLAVAQAAEVNAQALLSIADTFSAGSVSIGSALSISNSKDVLVADNTVEKE